MKPRGFSTLELLIAFALGSLLIVAVVSIAFGAQYWLLASRTSGEALYKAKTALEDLRSAARLEFQLASSTAKAADLSDESCADGGLCYFVESVVTDLSPCSKEVAATVEWTIPNYGLASTTLTTSLADPNAIVSLGSDCPLAQPAGEWDSTSDDSSGGIVGTITGLDVFDGITYVTTDAAPYLFILDDDGDVIAFANAFTETVRLNAIDVARDQSTGQLFAYVAREDGAAQLGIIDVTDAANPVLAATPYKLPDSSNPGWRVYVYARTAYVSTFDVGGREFTAVNVATPSLPSALGSADINTTAHGIAVRTQYINGAVRRLAYLATPTDGSELRVLDVTDGSALSEIGSANLPTVQDGRSIFLAGNQVYVGTESGGDDDLYVLDVWDPDGSMPLLASTEIGGTVSAIRVSGDFVFVARTSGTDEVLILDSATLAEVGSESVSGFAHPALDYEGDIVYAGGTSLHRITSP